MKKHIIIFAIALSILFVFVGAYRWGYDSVILLRQSVVKLDADVRGKQELLARSGTEAATVVSLIQDEAVINRYIVTNVSVVKFLNVFEAIGRATGAAVSVVSVSKQTEKGKPVYAISISAQGSFSAVMNTVGAIETMPYYITTHMVSLSNAPVPGSSTSGAGSSTWSASMTLTVAATNVVSTTTVSVATVASSTIAAPAGTVSTVSAGAATTATSPTAAVPAIAH